MPSTAAILHSANQDLRTLVQALGFGQFNATMVIPYMYWTPAATDPDMPAIRLIVAQLQRALASMGANVTPTAIIDERTGLELEKLTGPNWPGMTWATLYQAVLHAKASGRDLSPVVQRTDPELEMVGLLPSFPSIPGGAVTIAVGAGAFWYFFLRSKRR